MGQVYRHVSPAGKSYIGMTRFDWEHRFGNRPKSAYTGKMRSAVLKYGWENFEHIVLEESDDLDFLKEREVFWIEHFDSIENGYNQRHPLYFSKESPKRKEIADLLEARPDIENMYFHERFSIDEIASRYNVSFWSIREILLSLGRGLLPRGSVGKSARAKIELQEPVSCQWCRSDFVRKRSSQRYCSSNCVSLSMRKSPKRETRKAPEGFTRAKWAGIVSAHSRHHTGDRKSSKCMICIAE